MSTELTTTELPKELAELKSTAVGLPQDKADKILMSFAPAMTRLTELSVEMEKINFENPTDLDAEIARKIRLKMVPERTGTGRMKDKLKEDIKLEDKLIMSSCNMIVTAFEMKEKKLKDVEDFRQKLIDAENVRILEVRKGLLEPFNQAYDAVMIGAMSEEVFSNYLAGVKASHEAKIEAERKAEEQRLEQERITNLHNQRKEALIHVWGFLSVDQRTMNFGILSTEDFTQLLHGAEEKKVVDEKEREKERAEAERLRKEKEAAEAKAKAEREEAEAKLKAEQDKARKEKEAAELKAKQEREALEKQLAEERAEKARIEAEQRAKEEAEAKRLEEERKAAEKAAKAPKKKRMKSWVESLTITIPEGLESDKTAVEIAEKFNSFKKWAQSKIENI